jgi:hypothetical protein
MDEDRTSGTARSVGGKIEEGVGRVTGDARTQILVGRLRPILSVCFSGSESEFPIDSLDFVVLHAFFRKRNANGVWLTPFSIPPHHRLADTGSVGENSQRPRRRRNTGGAEERHMNMLPDVPRGSATCPAGRGCSDHPRSLTGLTAPRREMERNGEIPEACCSKPPYATAAASSGKRAKDAILA